MPRHPQVHFRIKGKDSQGNSQVYLQFLYNKKRLFYSLGQKVKRSEWDKAKQRIKAQKSTITDNRHELNQLLDRLENDCKRAYNAELVKGIPEPQTLRNYLDAAMNKTGAKATGFIELLDRFIANEIKFEGGKKTKSTLKTYNTLKGHILEFQALKRYRVDFDTINVDFFNRFVSFLQERGDNNKQIRDFWKGRLGSEFTERPIVNLSKNSIAKDIQIIKTVMNQAVDQNLTTNIEYKKKSFAAKREETDSVYLREDEIQRLEELDLAGDIKLQRARDMFLIGCYTGLRFSDYSNIVPDNINRETGFPVLEIKTKKTGTVVTIPLIPKAIAILEKYNNDFRAITGARRASIVYTQVFNPLIREVCKRAGLTVKGRLADNQGLELWECVSSHTARRSFATNMLTNDVLTMDEIMTITGHKTEKSFRRYIKITREEKVKTISEKLYNRISNGHLRIAN